MTEQKPATNLLAPGAENVEHFLSLLPAGIKEAATLMRSLDDGLLYPRTAIRYWNEMAFLTDDGREISSSGSQWAVAAWVSGRGWVADALASTTKQHYEAWSLHGPKPQIIDYAPDLSNNLHGKAGRHTEIVEQDVRDFARAYILDYYTIHPSNVRYVEILSCEHHNEHHANWECTVNFSAKGDQVTLLIQPTTRGLEVFAHKYEKEEAK